MLDHVYALHQGASRSGQPTLIEQVGSFQNACRDAARRVGLTPFTASEAEPFDAERHQLVEEGPTPPADAVVGETVAVGYTFQGRLLRPALVRLRGNDAVAAAAATEAGPEDQSQLPLQAENAGPQ
jgi:molecular chaperone GrpE (heat shock protein)